MSYYGYGYNDGHRPQENYGGGLTNQFEPSAPMPPPNYNPYGGPPAPPNYNPYGSPPPPPHNQYQGFPTPANYNPYGGPPIPPPHNQYQNFPAPPTYNPYGSPPARPNYNSYGGPPPTNYGPPLNNPVPSNYGSYPDQYGAAGQSSINHPPKGGSLINKLEKLVHMDLNHDGTIGGKPINHSHHKH